MSTDAEGNELPCISCGEKMPTGECPNSKRPCGHHCDCSWLHDVCHWCGAEFGEADAERVFADSVKVTVKVEDSVTATLRKIAAQIDAIPRVEFRPMVPPQQLPPIGVIPRSMFSARANVEAALAYIRARYAEPWKPWPTDAWRQEPERWAGYDCEGMGV